MLEDTFSDIIGKARFGLGYSLPDLAGRSGLPEGRISRLEGGETPMRKEVARLASQLSLDTKKLSDIALETWEPEPIFSTRQFCKIDSEEAVIRRIDGRIGSYPVNGYLFIDRIKGVGALFDTGYSPERVLRLLKEEAVQLAALCITHAHPDHVGGADTIRAATGVPIYLHPNETSIGKKPARGFVPLEGGRSIPVGRFQIRPLKTPGHTAGGTTYFIETTPYFKRPIAFVGDALFAGSLGRAQSPSSYPLLLHSVRKTLLSLPKKTILFPGHGPATTVEEEQLHNPFFIGPFT